jgi:hypothetical protein
MSLAFREEMQRLTTAIGNDLRQESVAQIESELADIFGDTGREVLLIEFSNRYGVTAADAIRRPGAFHTALYYLLGEHGSSFVMDRINRRIKVTAAVPS